MSEAGVPEHSYPAGPRGGSVREVFAAFLKLGLVSFGGPTAHIGFFRAEFVARRKWLTDATFGELVALCQVLPGPASSQLGFAIGLRRGGVWGAAAAFLGFTAPSVAIMLGFALGAQVFDGPLVGAVTAGLTSVAVAVVAHAIWGMWPGLVAGRSAWVIAAAALLLVVSWSHPAAQPAAIGLGAAAGWLLHRVRARGARRAGAESGGGNGGDGSGAVGGRVVGGRVVGGRVVGGRVVGGRGEVPVWAGICSLATLLVFLVGAPLLLLAIAGGGSGAGSNGGLTGLSALIDTFARAGALVFGGGHAVLPLLEAGTVAPGWVSPSDFLSGYGLAQAVPGPMFSFAAYLGAISAVGPGGVLGGLIAVVAIFAPGFLLLFGILPFWNTLRTRPGLAASFRGAGAAVMGVLVAALCGPVAAGGLTSWAAAGIAAVALTLLVLKTRPWVVVLLGALAGAGAFAVGVSL